MGWDSWAAADTYGKGAHKSGYTVTACQFCGRWHCKPGDALKTGMRRQA